MSKHQAILDYLEKLPIGKRVSVRSISNYLQVGLPIGPLKKLKIVELLKRDLVVGLFVSSPKRLS